MIEPNTPYPIVRTHCFEKQRQDQDVICIRYDGCELASAWQQGTSACGTDPPRMYGPRLQQLLLACMSKSIGRLEPDDMWSSVGAQMIQKLKCRRFQTSMGCLTTARIGTHASLEALAKALDRQQLYSSVHVHRACWRIHSMLVVVLTTCTSTHVHLVSGVSI